MMRIDLSQLEEQAFKQGFLLRIQVRRPLNLWTMRLVVADSISDKKLRILGEMKAWAYKGVKGFQLDTMRVHPEAPKGIGHLVWAASMAWALEVTPCKKARLLAIRDEEFQYSRLVNYFSRRGFNTVKEVGSAPFDLPLRIVWGGAGALMVGDCSEVFEKSFNLWEKSQICLSSN